LLEGQQVSTSAEQPGLLLMCCEEFRNDSARETGFSESGNPPHQAQGQIPRRRFIEQWQRGWGNAVNLMVT
jgi:hypothetical protein